MIPHEQWVWMPHPGHFVGAFDCRFRLNTRIGNYIISTIGELFPDAPVREIYAQLRGIVLKGEGDDRKADYMDKIGYEEIGYQRKYETMVFKAERSEEYECCPWVIVVNELEKETDVYNSPDDASKGHMKMCMKYALENEE